MLKKLEQLLILSTLGLSAAHAAPTNGTFIRGSGDITVNGQETVLNVTDFNPQYGYGRPKAHVKVDSLDVSAAEQLTITCAIPEQYTELPVILVSTDTITQAQVAGKIYSNSCVVLLASPGGWKTTATATLEMPGMMLAAVDSASIDYANYSYTLALHLNNKPIQTDPSTKFIWDYSASYSGSGWRQILYVNGRNTTPITLVDTEIYALGDSADDALVSSGVWGTGSFITNVPMEISGKVVATGRNSHPEWGASQRMEFMPSSSSQGGYPGYSYPNYPAPVASKLFTIGHLEFEGSQANPLLKSLSTSMSFYSPDVIDIGSFSNGVVNKKSTDSFFVRFIGPWQGSNQPLVGNLTMDGVGLSLSKIDFTGAINIQNQTSISLSSSTLFGTINAVNSGVSAIEGSKLAAGGSITVSGTNSNGKPAGASFSYFTNEGTITVPSALSNAVASCYDSASDSWLDCNIIESTLNLAGTITNYGTMNIGHSSTSYGSLTLENFGSIISLSDASLWADTLLNDGGIKAYGTVSASNQSGSGTITQVKMTAPQIFSKARNASALTVNNYGNGWINLQKTAIAQKSATPLVAKPAPVVAVKPAPVATAPVAVAKKPVAALAQPAPVVVQKSAKTILTR